MNAHPSGSLCYDRRSISPLRDRLKGAETYADFRRVCLEVDREEGTDKWREEERDLPQAVLLRRTIEELEEALRTGNLAQLKFLLGGVFRVRRWIEGRRRPLLLAASLCC